MIYGKINGEFLKFLQISSELTFKWLVWSTINHFDLCKIFVVLKSFMFKLPCLFWNAVGNQTEKINYSVCSWIDTNTWDKEHYTIDINPHVLSKSISCFTKFQVLTKKQKSRHIDDVLPAISFFTFSLNPKSVSVSIWYMMTLQNTILCVFVF